MINKLKIQRFLSDTISRIKFMYLYSYMKNLSTDAKKLHYGFAYGTINGYKWRLFQKPVCFVGIKDKTSKGSEWPAFYYRNQIKKWFKNN